MANFGVVITRLGPGAKVEPRIVSAGDENRLLGFAALPFDLNPYLRSFQEPVLAAGAIGPPAGAYDVVFDGARAGSFTFRFWIDDTTPPSVTLLKRTVARGTPLVVRVTDSGSGVYARSLAVEVDGEERRARLASDGTVRLATGGLTRGRPRPVRSGLRRPGEPQHGERRGDPAEHPRPADDVHRPVAGLVPQILSFSSIVGRRSRSRCTLATKSSFSPLTTFSCALRRRRSRARRASGPTRRLTRGHSTPTSSAAAMASSTIQGQPTTQMVAARGP